MFGSSNIVWGEDDQYGIVDVPGQKVLHLPARKMDVSYAVDIVGKGNETVDVPIPKLSLSVVRVGGPDDVKFKESFGSSENANEDGVNSQRRVWKIDVPKAGDYRVEADGDGDVGRDQPGALVRPRAADPRLHGADPRGDLTLIAMAVYFVRQRRRQRRMDAIAAEG